MLGACLRRHRHERRRMPHDQAREALAAATELWEEDGEGSMEERAAEVVRLLLEAGFDHVRRLARNSGPPCIKEFIRLYVA